MWIRTKPGIPAILPRERINGAVIEYLRSSADAGMVLPDPADPSMKNVRVVANDHPGA
ncbi:hypothetical protein [Arthrobacter sp. D1-17]